jgi:general nucleoside transport system permease protein
MTDLGTTSATIDEERPEVAAEARQRSRRGISLEVIGLYVICIAGALVLAALLVAATGGSWTAVFSAILDGSILNEGRIGLTLAVSAPILLVALGTIVNGRAGLVNIGQEGQLVMGSCFAAFAAGRLTGPGPFILITSMLIGIVGGAIWAGIAGVLRYWRNVPEVLTTLLLGSVAANLMGFALRHESLLLAPASGRANRNQVSEPLPEGARIPRVTWFGNEFPISVFLAVGLAVILSIVLGRTVVGFRLRMLGRNPGTAMRAGVAERRYGLGAMLVSGGFSGLAGGIMLAGGDFGNYQLVANFGAGIGFAGLLAALVARQRVLVAIFVAFIFGGLRTGSGFLRATGVSGRIADVVQGLLVLSLLLPPAMLYIRERRRALAATTART